MALTTVSRRDDLPRSSAMRELAVQLNALIANFDALLVKLDADVGVTDVDYESTLDGASRVADLTNEVFS